MNIKESEQLRDKLCKCGNKHLFYQFHEVECEYYIAMKKEEDSLNYITIKRPVVEPIVPQDDRELSEVRKRQAERREEYYYKADEGRDVYIKYISAITDIDYLLNRLSAAEQVVREFAKRAGFKTKL